MIQSPGCHPKIIFRFTKIIIFPASNDFTSSQEYSFSAEDSLSDICICKTHRAGESGQPNVTDVVSLIDQFIIFDKCKMMIFKYV